MRRIGVHFEGMPTVDQVQLDRYIFEQLRREAWQKRHLRGLATSPALERGSDKRLTRRIRVTKTWDLLLRVQLIDEEEESQETLLKEPVSAPVLTDSEDANTPVFKIYDISTSGCSYLCTETHAPPAGAVLRLFIEGEKLSLQVQGRVIYVG